MSIHEPAASKALLPHKTLFRMDDFVFPLMARKVRRHQVFGEEAYVAVLVRVILPPAMRLAIGQDWEQPPAPSPVRNSMIVDAY